MTDTRVAYHLVRGAGPAAPPLELDDDQRAVVEHAGGPLLVLAGPGTGKTTTLVEAVAARVAAGLDPEQVLVLTFSRRAAGELRERITARLGGTLKEPLARTFHSYAFGLLRREAAARGEPAPRLLSGAEQDLLIRELLRGDVAHDDALAPGSGVRRWPAALRAALPARGFAQQLRDLLLRCHERGIDAVALARLAEREERGDWAAAARFVRQYDDVTGLRAGTTQGPTAYDPAELIREVIGRWRAEPALLAQERVQRQAVFVDEFQDTDPGQVEMLGLLAGDGRDLTVVGDPDQSIYAFRGADADGLRRFPERFRTAAGDPAPVLALRTCRRAGTPLLAATRRVAGRLGGPGRHRQLVPAPATGNGAGETVVETHVLRSAGHEAAFIAHRLRTAHLHDGVPWSGMAVLVRSTAATLPVLRRALTAAGVPVSVSLDEVPLVEQPAVQVLLRLLGCALHPETLDEDRAVELLTSPLGGADALGLRRLRQELRRVELAAGGRLGSGALLVEALRTLPETPGALALLPERARRPAERVAALIRTARRAVAAGAAAEDVLWSVWSESGLAARWQRDSAAGGQRGAAADRDLDAVGALFDAAARFADRLPAAGPQLLLEHLQGQQIPADTLAARAVGGDAVAVLTAHASKGLEWDVVAVAGVQEGSWPDLRLRGSFLGVERLAELTGASGDAGEPDRGAPAAAAALSRQLDEERRLFYVASTRARRVLLVTAVASERESLQPSRFLDELLAPDGDEASQPPDGQRAMTDLPRSLTLPALVGELRQALVSGETSAQERAAAAAQLARLSAAGVRGADPARWHGLGELSDAGALVDAADEVVVSPSKVESFLRCRLRWFIEHVGGTEAQQSNQTLGTLVHDVAALAVDPGRADEEFLLKRLDEALAGADLGRGWSARRNREQATEMVQRLARWLADNPRAVVATEVDFDARVGRARLRGRVDRLERDAAGRAVVVDFKTASTPVEGKELPRHPQLAAYQLAVKAGGFAEQGLTSSGGAELVQLGKGGKGKHARPQAQPALGGSDSNSDSNPDPDSDPGWAERLIVEVVQGMAGSVFEAIDNDRCRRCPVRTSCPLQNAGRQVTA